MISAITQIQNFQVTGPVNPKWYFLESKNQLGNAPKYQLSALKHIQAPIKAKISIKLHVAKIIKAFLIKRLSTPKITHRMGITIQRVRLAGFVLMKQNATLFIVKDIIRPIHPPSMKIPNLGKYPKTYPAKKLHMPVNIRMFSTKFCGTPGQKIMGIYMTRSIKNIVHAPSSTMEALYMQNPNVIKMTPIIQIVIANANCLSLKNENIVEYSTSGHPAPLPIHQYVSLTFLSIRSSTVLSTNQQFTATPLLIFFSSNSVIFFCLYAQHPRVPYTLINDPFTTLCVLLQQYSTQQQQLYIILFCILFSLVYQVLSVQYTPYIQNILQILSLKHSIEVIIVNISNVMSKFEFVFYFIFFIYFVYIYLCLYMFYVICIMGINGQTGIQYKIVGMKLNGSPNKYPHRKLLISSGDIALPKHNKIKIAKQTPTLSSHNDKFTSFKEQYQLPTFHKSLDKQQQRHSIDVKSRLRTLQSRPDRYRIKSNLRSKTIVSDNNFQKFVRKELCSLDLGDLRESIVLDHLDQKYLTDYQREQIKKFKNIYYIGYKAHQRKHPKDKFNDAKGNYKPLIGDHIGYRFEIIKILGSGAFGKVLQVFDHKTKKNYALKILKQSEELYEQFQLQVKILKIARDHPSTNKNIIEIKGDFEFRGHVCIVTEMLSLNLYSFIKAQNYEGLDIDVVRKILIQVLQALLFLHHRNIIHCDIKLQNIVFREMGKSGIKLIDFGSACFFDRKQFTYIQSRYYRSPQIVLIKPYDRKIDIWSLGCVLFQLFTGSPLFPSRNQNQQMTMINSTLGPPPQYFLKECERGQQFKFQKKGNPELSIRSRMKCDDQDFINMIQQMIKWSPQQRIQAIDALKHPFILNGLPKQVRNEHIKQMNSQNPYNLY